MKGVRGRSRARLEVTRQLLIEQPRMTARDLAALMQISLSSASGYLQAARQVEAPPAADDPRAPLVIPVFLDLR